jgi:hypothetical protein
MKITKIIKKIKKNPRMILAYINATGVMNYFSDDTIIRMLWWVKTGEKLNINSPRTFNEKIQWLKLNNHDPHLHQYVDKYAVRDYVKNILGEDCLIPLIGVWDNPNEINFNELPSKFVLKCNHNAAIGLCICRNKDELDKNYVVKGLKRGLKNSFYYSSREWAYKDVPRKVICEKYMENKNGEELRDYKFFCFNGHAKFVYISEGLENHDTANISFYDLNGNEMPFRRKDYTPFLKKPTFPNNFNEMVEAANKLSRNTKLPFVRIDLYSIDEKMYFSEITCYPNSGYIPFDPQEWDLIVGEWIDLSSVQKSNMREVK